MRAVSDMHPALKIIAFGLLFSVLPFTISGIWTHAVVLAILVAMIVGMRIPYSQIRTTYPALAVVVLTVVSYLAVDAGGPTVAAIPLGPWTWEIRQGSVYYATRMASRTVIWVAAYLILLATTPNRAFVAGLMALRVPRSAAIAFAMTIKFWGQVVQDTQMIVEAQRARGVDFHRGSPWRLFYVRFIATLLPIFFVMFKRFRTMSYALTLRGLGAPAVPTQFYKPAVRARDWLAFGGIVALQAACVILDRTVF